MGKAATSCGAWGLAALEVLGEGDAGVVARGGDVHPAATASMRQHPNTTSRGIATTYGKVD
jgi:hypothetical protein